MITLLAASVFFTNGAAAPTTMPSLMAPKAAHSLAAVTWADVQDYIVSHATVRDYIAETLLQAEATLGVKSWCMVQAVSNSSGLSFSAKLDGPGLGWPVPGHVVRFANTAQANTAAAMIDAVTTGH